MCGGIAALRSEFTEFGVCFTQYFQKQEPCILHHRNPEEPENESNVQNEGDFGFGNSLLKESVTL